MKYTIKLNDDSFILADDSYKMTLFYKRKKRIISIEEYLNKSKYWKYYMLDKIDNKIVRRYFIIEGLDPMYMPHNLDNIPIGSRLKLAENIKENDLVVGPDGNPRRVQELHTGQDDMYEIAVEGKKYVVNGGHILALVDKDTGEHLDIPVNIYMHMDDEFRTHWVMEKVID